MRPVVVQGGWRMWALLIGGGAVLLVLGLTVGLLLLGLLAVAGVLLLAQRALQAIGLGGRRASVHAATAPDDGVIDGEFHVVSRQTTVNNQLRAPRE